uniref:formylglycine-generating enzyme family protein n=1 Tax=Candidatus Chloroploca sp. Khr17 TaxID=2496869 RepID=UPI0013EA2972
AQGAGEDYVFPHQTFQEYLAGLELVSRPAFVEQMMAVRHDDRWQIPMMLGLGHAVHEGLFAIPYQFLNRLRCLRERSAGQRQQDLLLAAVIAADVGWKRLRRGGDEFEQLQADLAADLASLITDPTVPVAVRVQAGALVAPLGDPRPGVCTLPPAMVALPGGSVMLGVTAAERAELPEEWQGWFARSENEVEVPVPGFAIGRYPVTNAQYAVFLAEGGYDPTAPWWDAAGRAWLARDDAATEGLERWQQRQRKDQPEAWDDEAFGHGRVNYPVVGVNWYEAMAFGRWLTAYLDDGFVYRLPSEAEWEYAARGPMRRIYPWGAAEPEGERANFDQIYRGTTAVGCFPAGATPDGVLDLAGNVWEWTRSVYRPYPYDPEPDNGREEEADAARKRFTLRGGSWYDVSFHLRAANRNLNSPVNHFRVVGFRLARHPHV